MSLIKILSKQRYKQSQPYKSSVVYTNPYGSPVTPETSLEVAAFFRALVYISTQVGKMPLDIKDLDNKILNKDNDIWFLLNRAPNSEMSAFHWRTLMVQLCVLRGNGFSEIVKDVQGRIRSIVPIINHDICLIRDKNGELFYQMSNTKTGDMVYLRKDEVLHFRNIYTEDGINGLATINYAAKALGIAKGADKMAGALFNNGGLPSGTLETERVLSPDVIDRLKEEWKKKFGGNKAGGVAVLEEGMKFNPLNYAPDVLQFLESRQFSVLEIARFMGVPPSKLYVLEAQSYNNIEHSNLEVSNDTIDVWARNFEGEFDMKMFRDRNKKTEFDLYAINRGDMDTRAEYFSKMLSNGSITPNEIRRKEGLEPYDEGDEFYIATNNLTPVSRHDEIIDSQLKSKESKTKENNTNDDLAKAMIDKIKSKR